MSDRDAHTYTTPDGETHPMPEHRCSDGWIGEDLDGRPRPCPVCRGHLRRRRGEDREHGLTGYTAARPSPHGATS
jgi:hypothetical protein